MALSKGSTRNHQTGSYPKSSSVSVLVLPPMSCSIHGRPPSALFSHCPDTGADPHCHMPPLLPEHSMSIWGVLNVTATAEASEPGVTLSVRSPLTQPGPLLGRMVSSRDCGSGGKGVRLKKAPLALELRKCAYFSGKATYRGQVHCGANKMKLLNCPHS